MAYTAPTVANFKAQFARDFPYGTDPNIAVLDTDITNAFVFTDNTINQSLWGSQSIYTMAYCLLAAHFMVLSLRAGSQGLNGQWTWLQNSKGVGAVNEAFGIPQRVLDNPDFAQYYKTNYGAQYMNLLWPQLSGQVLTVCGGTQP